MTQSEHADVRIVLAHFGEPFSRVRFDCLEGGMDLEAKAARTYRAIAHSMTMDEKVRALDDGGP